MATIGDRIKEKRKELGLTQAELGEKLNVTDRAVSKWEQNDGNPDMSIIAPLASFLGVTLDYLITGKVQEEKIVIKTPKEMLIETDDPTYLEKVNDLTIGDLYKNRLVKVFSYLVDSKKINNYYGGRLRAKDYKSEIIYMCLISNNLDKFTVFGFNDIGYADSKEWTKEMMDVFVSDEKVSDQTRNCVLTTHCRTLNGVNSGNGANTETRHRFGNWQDMYPKFLDAFAAAKKWEWVKYLISVADDINKPAIEEYNKQKDVRYGDGNNYHICYTTPKETFGNEKFVQVMVISYTTLNCLLNEKQYDLLEEANSANALINKLTIPSKNIELEKMKNNSNVQLKSRLIFEFTSDYILNYNALFDSKTVSVNGPSKDEDTDGYLEALLKQYKKLYQEILEESPISFIELVYRGVKNNDLSSIYKLSFDYQIKLMLDALMNGDPKAIIESAKKSFLYTETKTEEPRRGRASVQTTYTLNNKRIKFSEIMYTHGLSNVSSFDEIPDDINAALKYFDNVKRNIFNEWVDRIESNIKRFGIKKENKQEYERISSEITSEYIYGLISEGNEEKAIIKLCVRLESVLKHKYDFSGDLFTMLDNFFEGPLKNVETAKPNDDEDNNYQYEMDQYYKQTELNKTHAKWIDSLSKLRMKRNNIVHAEKGVVDFSTKELEDCINIIEEIDK